MFGPQGFILLVIMKKLSVTKEELADLYLNKKTSPTEIANIFDVSRAAIYKRLKKFDIYIKFNDLIYQERQQFFTQDVDEYIIGVLLGDGHIEANTSNKAGRLEISHSIKQKDYLVWQANIMAGLISSLREGEAKLNGKVHGTCGFHTLSHPLFLKYRDLFYDAGGKKIIRPEIKNRLTEKGLAIWIMDDGSYHRGDKIRISTDCFSYEHHLILQDILKDNFDLNVNICKQTRNGKSFCYLEFNKTNAIKLSDIIRPYVIESMKYKLVD